MPLVKVSRSRTVISRRAGTVSSSAVPGELSTRRAPSSGIQSRISSSSSRTPSLISSAASTMPTILLSDAMRNGESSVIRRLPARSYEPVA